MAAILPVTGYAQQNPLQSGSVSLLNIKELFSAPQSYAIDTDDCTLLKAVRAKQKNFLACVHRSAPDSIRLLPISEGVSESMPFALGGTVARLAVADLDGDNSDDIAALTANNPHMLIVLRSSESFAAPVSIPLPPAQRELPDVFSAHAENCGQIRRYVTFGYYELDGSLRLTDLALATTSPLGVTTTLPTPHNISDLRIPASDRPQLRSFTHLPSVCRGSISLDPRSISVTQRDRSRALLHPIPAPEGFAWESAIDGDFTGDGKLDVLSYAGPLGGWWLTSFASRAPLPRSVSFLRAVPRAGRPPIAADFNGDRRTDLLFQRAKSIEILYSRATPLPQVAVEIDGRAIATTDSEGRYSFTPPAIPYRLAAAVRRNNGTVVREERVIDGALVAADFVFTNAHLSDNTLGRFPQDGPPLPGPYACFGISADRSVEGVTEGLCPPGHYIVAIDDISNPQAQSQQPTPRATCCPLPSADLLTDEETSVAGDCPPDSIAIGYQRWFGPTPYPLTLRCGKLDTARVRRGSAQAGIYYGPRTGTPGVDVSTAPVALRSALGRIALRSWDVDGCTAASWGAPLISVAGRQCERLRFAELISPTGIPLVMFPQCVAGESRFDPDAGCQ